MIARICLIASFMIVTISYNLCAQPPQVTSFMIAEGSAYTTTRTVNLSNTCTGSPTFYIASESPTFSGTAWKPYAANSTFSLSGGHGIKTVYFMVKNAKNERSPKVSDTISFEVDVKPIGLPSLSADRKTIAYLMQDGHTLRVHRERDNRYFSFTFKQPVYNPKLSPDGSKIYYTRLSPLPTSILTSFV